MGNVILLIFALIGLRLVYVHGFEYGMERALRIVFFTLLAASLIFGFLGQDWKLFLVLIFAVCVIKALENFQNRPKTPVVLPKPEPNPHWDATRQIEQAEDPWDQLGKDGWR